MKGVKKVLCLGGAGALGSGLMATLSSGYLLTSVDYREVPNMNNVKNVLLKQGSTPKETFNHIKSELGDMKFHAIVVTAGGWRGGSIKSDTFLEDYETMRDMNLLPSLYAAKLATTHLNVEGLLVFTGAAAVFKEPQPEMLAYSLAKTGVHSLALNLSNSKVMPEDNTVLTILPETINTEANRQSMPKANFDEWANVRQIGELLKGWIDGLNRPSTGSFIVLKVKNKSIVPEFV